jgi:cytochrome c oxidase assembly protein subunit 15
MALFRRVSIASLVATLLLVAIGGLVRATKSGLGCGTDWPDCSGRLLPALETRAEIIEFSHRLMASVVVILIGVLVALAIRHHRRTPAILWPSVGAFALVMWQAILGMIVVKLELEAESVVLHLATALALVALLVYLAAAGAAVDGGLSAEPQRHTSRKASAAAGAVLVLMLVGSYVTGREAGYVFSDWPLMGGRLIPDLGVELYAIHFVHRVLAVVVGGIVLAIALSIIRSKSARPLPTRLAYVALGGFATEVLVGAGNVWTELNSALVTIHLLLGTVIWTSLVGIAVVSHPALQAIAGRAPVPTPRPVLEVEVGS